MKLLISESTHAEQNIETFILDRPQGISKLTDESMQKIIERCRYIQNLQLSNLKHISEEFSGQMVKIIQQIN